MSGQARLQEPDPLVLLNTADGKGKSTAAFGVVAHALAQNWRVGVIQFLKSNNWETGEEAVFRRLGVEWIKSGGGFTWKNGSGESSRSRARAAWERAASELGRGHFRLLVLDEITLPLSFGWLEEEDVVRIIRDRAAATNVILTGRNAPASLLELADVVTEMKNVRHPFDRGVVARAGIDY